MKKKYAWEGKMIPNKSTIELLNEVDINSVQPYPDNPFDHRNNVRDIANSIIQFGFSKVSVGVDENNVLLYGHGTLEALKLLNWTKIPCVLRVTGLNEEEKRAYRIADNTTTSRSRLVHELIKKEMDKQMSFDLTLFGLNEEELMLAQKSDTVAGELATISKDFADQAGASKKVGIKSKWLFVEYSNEKDWERVKEIFTARGTRELDPSKVLSAAILFEQSQNLPGTETPAAEQPAPGGDNVQS